ncbi:1,4-alpha-glucan branching enzyme GlgB [Mobiluncus mulieris]|nr:1,4-alpha-glucan branching enzyme GlgB [Mobiluncus mulieris]
MPRRRATVRPMISGIWWDQLHQAGIGVILDWVPAHFPKDDWALAGFDGHGALRGSRPAAWPAPGLGALWCSILGRREVKNFLVANALYWMQEFHIDGLRVDAVASMLYLDYSRKEGQWHPNVYGGRENLEAIALLQEVLRGVLPGVPGHHHDCRGIHGLARCDRADQRRWAWFWVQVEYGLDE